MGLHYTTFVLPGSLTGFDYATPVLTLGAETEPEIADIPLVTSLHRIGNEIKPLVHASLTGIVFPVSDTWIHVVETDYDKRAKVVVLRAPLPADISTTWAEIAEGVGGPDLPPWVGAVVAQEVPMGMRDVPVSSGTDALDIMIAPGAPTTWPEWAHVIVGGPQDN